MKALVGFFTTESNAHIPHKNDITNYAIAFGDECIRLMQIGEIFERAGIGMIPAIYAKGGPSGVIRRETFDYIEACFVRAVREHLDEIDGIYLFLHGASEVEGIGSGDHHILKKIRELVGPYLPICVACDPHGNLCKEYVEATTVIRSFRESPHTDSLATQHRVAETLCRLMKERQNIHSVYRKLPLILGGEQSVSFDEPVRSINQYMDTLEKDPRILSVSWHVGYIRHDTPVAGSGIVVVPSAAEDQAYAEEVADRLAQFVWERRHEFHYTGLTAQPEEAMRLALECGDGLVFISDSGDNTGSGAGGWNTYILRQALAVENLQKRFLFATICDPGAFRKLDALEPGAETHLRLGVGYDEWSAPVELEVRVRSKGMLRGCSMFGPVDVCHGHVVVVSLTDRPIDIAVADTRYGLGEEQQFDGIGAYWSNYDVIVVKQGYIFPELKAKGALSVMSLTGGATPQDTTAIPFHRIMRPMYPIDPI